MSVEPQCAKSEFFSTLRASFEMLIGKTMAREIVEGCDVVVETLDVEPAKTEACRQTPADC